MELAPVPAFMPGLAVYRPMSEEKLGPTLSAADKLGLADVVCIDDNLQGSGVLALAERVLGKNTTMRVRHAPSNLSPTSNFSFFADHPWGVFAAHEMGVEGAALLANQLQSSGLLQPRTKVHSLEAAHMLRFKDAFRLHVNSQVAPFHEEVMPIWNGTFPVQALSVATLREAGAPDIVIVKPRNSSGSRGVEPIDLESPDANAQLSSIAGELLYLQGNPVDRATDTQTVQVETFVMGEEYSVEGFFKDGKAHVCAIHWKPDMYKDWKATGQFIEGRFVTLPPDRPEFALLERTNQAILASIPGLGDTVIHAEYRIGAETGKVLPLEIGGRVGGGSLAESSEQFSGVNLVEAGVRLATGLPIVMPGGPYRLTSEAIIYPEQDGTLDNFYLALPGEPTMDAVEGEEERLKNALNRWLGMVPRARAAAIYEEFPSEVPFDSSIRQQMRDAFDPKGGGLDAVVEKLHIWSKPGDRIIGFVSSHLGGLLLTSRTKPTGLATLADLGAAMSLCLAAFGSEVTPF